MIEAKRAYTLSDAIFGGLAGSGFVRAVALAFIGSLLIAGSAKIMLPFWPVPQTMQTFAVLILPMILGRRIGVAAVLLYLLEGALGLPVFAGTPERGLGVAYMAGPTGGYLCGFLMAASLVGGLAQRGWDRSIVTAAAAMAMGLVSIYIPGLVWLSGFVGVDEAIRFGLQPFLFADLLKLALAALLVPGVWKVLQFRRCRRN